MDQKITATLLELAVKSLLSSEPAVMHALEKEPKRSLCSIVQPAFFGGQEDPKSNGEGLAALLSPSWSLKAQESYYDILEAMIDGLPIPSPELFL